MAGVNPTPDQASDLLQNLSLDGQSKPLQIPEAANNGPANQPLSADSGNASNVHMQSTQMDPNVCYVPNAYQSGYFYPGYDNNSGQWEEYPPYPEAVDMNQGVYGDNSVLYHGYGYASYAPYSPAGSPVPTMGNDGQLYGPQQHYQYPSPYFQTTNATSGPYTPNTAVAPHTDIPASVGVEQKPLAVETVAANPDGGVSAGNVKGNNGPAAAKPSYQNTSFGSSGSYGRVAFSGGMPTSGYQDPRFAFDGLQSPPIPWLDGSVFQDGQSRPFSNAVTSSASKSNNGSSRNYNGRPNSHYMGLQHPRPLSGGYVNRMYPGNKLYSQYGSSYNSGMGFGSSGYGMRTNNRGWMAADNKNRPRGRNSGYYGYGSENTDGMNELNRGPRGKSTKNQKGFAPVALAVNGESVPLNRTDDEKEKNVGLDREQYNLPDFPEEYSDAKFLVIKSYSEDDVHKCIKYNVWASTPNGNKKLDAVYKEAQEKAGGCPVFLFFSVNGSGQFVGIAEMVGPVDFNKSCEYWQQDKWTGSFPVKWHIVKDVPNSSLKHITLENNENKPVTNSRDTQEVKLEPGLKVLKIFKEHSSQTCILDDFEFYENRQKTIQEKKAKQQQFQKQVWEGKSIGEKKESVNDEQKSTEGVSGSSKDGIPSGDLDGSVVKTADAPKGAAPVALSEKKIENGVANGH